MDRFERLLVLMLLRDQNLSACKIADWIRSSSEERRQRAKDWSPKSVEQLETLLAANGWDSQLAFDTLRESSVEDRWLQVCTELASRESIVSERVVERLLFAQGGLGSVWKARDPTSERVVAVKEMRAELADNAALARRFMLEAKTTARLEHPSIVPVYWISPETPLSPPNYVMRFLEGETLGSAVTRLHEQRRQQPKQFAEGIRTLIGRFLRACEALAYAHSRGVIHRDLKPENIILSDFGSVFLIDWGLAKVKGTNDETTGDSSNSPMSESDLTRAGTRIGTPLWMAPEQAAGLTGSLDERTDVYGLGATLFTLLTGKPPHAGYGANNSDQLLARVVSGPTPQCRDIVPTTSPVLEAICAKAMSVDPSQRYADVESFAADLRCWLDHKPVSAYPESALRRGARWSLDHPHFSIPALVVMVGLLVTIATLPAVMYVRDYQLTQARIRLLHRQMDVMARMLNRDFQRIMDGVHATSASPEVRQWLQQPGNPPASLLTTIELQARHSDGFRSAQLISFDSPSFLRIGLKPDRATTSVELLDADVVKKLRERKEPRIRTSADGSAKKTARGDGHVYIDEPLAAENGGTPLGVIRFTVDIQSHFDEVLANALYTGWLGITDLQGNAFLSGRTDEDFLDLSGSDSPGALARQGSDWTTAAAVDFDFARHERNADVVQFLQDPTRRQAELAIHHHGLVILARRMLVGQATEPQFGIVLCSRLGALNLASNNLLVFFNAITAGAIVLSFTLGLGFWFWLRRLPRFS